jgi:hypothetical protein
VEPAFLTPGKSTLANATTAGWKPAFGIRLWSGFGTPVAGLPVPAFGIGLWAGFGTPVGLALRHEGEVKGGEAGAANP